MFSIILPVYDPMDCFVSEGVLPRAISSVLTLEGEFALVIVNNNSPSTSPLLAQYLKQLELDGDRRITIVSPGANLGTAKGFNAGLKASDPNSRYLVFMSSDAEVVDPLSLLKISALMENQPSVAIAHPISVFEDLETFNYSGRFGIKKFVDAVRNERSLDSLELSSEEIRQIVERLSHKTTTTRSMRSFPLTFAVLRREVIKLIGSFDEAVSLVCGENDDLAFRVLLSGYSVARLNSVFVNHRRYLYFRLSHHGIQPSMRLHHREGRTDMNIWWRNKWGRPYVELYTRWRYGPIVFSLILPIFWARRLLWYLRQRSPQNA